MKHLDVSEVFAFHIVFDEVLLSRAYYDVFEAIRGEIFTRLDELKARFEFDDELNEPMKNALLKLAKSDRKRFSLNKIMPQISANKVYTRLLELEIIYVEKSREKRPPRCKHQQLKRSERNYKVQDKLHFCSHFTRFWFRFIKPNLNALEAGKFDVVLAQIKAEFD